MELSIIMETNAKSTSLLQYYWFDALRAFSRHVIKLRTLYPISIYRRPARLDCTCTLYCTACTCSRYPDDTVSVRGRSRPYHQGHDWARRGIPSLWLQEANLTRTDVFLWGKNHATVVTINHVDLARRFVKVCHRQETRVHAPSGGRVQLFVTASQWWVRLNRTMESIKNRWC